MNDRISIWDVLGIERSGDVTQIRRAYARALKSTSPEDNPEGFQQLRAAYENALALAAHMQHEARVAQANVVTAAASVPVESVPPVANDPPPQESLESSPPAENLTDLQQAMTRLHHLLNSPQPAATDLQWAFKRVAASDALLNLSVRAAVERDVAYLIARAIPRSDPLLDAAIAEFGWTEQANAVGADAAVLAVVRRRGDLEWLRNLDRPEHPLHLGLKILSEPPRPWVLHPWMFVKRIELPIGRLLAVLRNLRPGLFVSLDEDSVRWWSEFLSKPRLSRIVIGAAVPVALIVSLIYANIHVNTHEPTPWTPVFLTGYLVSFAVLVGIGVLKLYAFDWPRFWWTTKGVQRNSLWLEYGWLPLCVATFALALVLPASKILASLFMTLGILSCLWLRATSRVEAAPVSLNMPIGTAAIRLAIPLGYGALLLANTEQAAAGQIGVAGIFLVILEQLGRNNLHAYWLQHVDSSGKQLMTKLLGFVAIVLGASAIGARDSAAATFFIGAIALLVLLAQRTLLLGLTANQRKGRAISLGVAGFVVISILMSTEQDGGELRDIHFIALLTALMHAGVLYTAVLTSLSLRPQGRHEAAFQRES